MLIAVFTRDSTTACNAALTLARIWFTNWNALERAGSWRLSKGA